ncbi:hypothetical protein EW146_g6967 [Bondarzewia mesenterica]|uniref:RRM domain-containing protein n=1 Tax=Bondarzewia mesenterica TaxID=1095465 RepID=A0A4S4LM19_9AGAM|nr:hypothetical protein EW146_g6967 [Bondarzewia mesenterica]
MASLLARMNIDPPEASVGPVRATKSKRTNSSPYQNRPIRTPKGDVNGTWQHDLFQTDGAGGKSLSARLAAPGSAPKMNFGVAERALREAAGGKGELGELSIRGASSRGNVVEVTGLVKGTTAADVEAIFKQCGPVTQSHEKVANGAVTVRLTFKHDKDAKSAETRFDKQFADGQMLHVKVIGGVNASLPGRLGVGVQDGSVDVLINSESTGGSKMRSDDILTDADARARAHVLVAPPGADPKEYTQQQGRGRGRVRMAYYRFTARTKLNSSRPEAAFSAKRVKSERNISSKSTPDATRLSTTTAAFQSNVVSKVPLDVWLEILVHYPTMTRDAVKGQDLINPVFERPFRERFDVLRALSQTCKDLRILLLPLAWSRLEVCTVRATCDQSFYKQVGEALKRKSEGLLKRSPHLLPLVQTVTVSLTRYAANRILPPFAQLLDALPNLNTIEVVHAHSAMTTALKTAFEGHTYPGVRTIILPTCAHEILKCCPGVEIVICTEGGGSQIISAIVKFKQSNLTVLEGIWWDEARTKRIAKVAPKLQISGST